MHKFFQILKTLGSVALPFVVPVVERFVPGFAPLINTFLNSILTAQHLIPTPGQGALRSQLAMTMIAANTPEIIQMIEQSTGKTLINDQKFGESLQEMNDALVKMLNAFEAFPSATPITLPAPELR
jgi:hypothetical protein